MLAGTVASGVATSSEPRRDGYLQAGLESGHGEGGGHTVEGFKSVKAVIRRPENLATALFKRSIPSSSIRNARDEASNNVEARFFFACATRENDVICSTADLGADSFRLRRTSVQDLNPLRGLLQCNHHRVPAQVVLVPACDNQEPRPDHSWA